MKEKKFPALDDFRLIAAILVVAVHTRSTDSEILWLLTVLRRIAVPFFIMVSGYFLARGNWRSTGKFLKNRHALWCKHSAVSALELLRRSVIIGFFRRAIFDGSFYHLWYLPRSCWVLRLPIASPA